MLDAVVRTIYRVGHRVMRVWWFVRRPSVHGAFVAVWHEGHLLLIRNSYRHGETLPSGRIERRETPRAAARRELLEEVGIDVPEESLIPTSEFELVVHHRNDRATVFELHVPVRPAVRVDRREVVWGEFVPEDELEERPLVPHVARYLAWRREQLG
jgi:8-oxo-dGTP pyrophosphatase MutT (NUDIX family)